MNRTNPVDVVSLTWETEADVFEQDSREVHPEARENRWNFIQSWFAADTELISALSLQVAAFVGSECHGGHSSATYLAK